MWERESAPRGKEIEASRAKEIKAGCGEKERRRDGDSMWIKESRVASEGNNDSGSGPGINGLARANP